MLWLTVCAAIATASPEVAADSDGVAEVLRAAADLAADNDHRAARGLLRWVLDQPITQAERSRAEAQLALLPTDLGEWTPKVRLAAWQAGLGAAAFGPGVVGIRQRYTPPGVVFATGLAGGIGGGAAALLYGRSGHLTDGKATGIILAQQLGVAHGLVAGSLLEDAGQFNPGRPRNNAVEIGMVAGTVAGTGLGYLAALKLTLDPDKLAGASSGALWGMGLTLAGMGITYQFGAAESPSGIGVPLLIGADLGAAGGYLLAQGLGLNRASIWGANLGAVATVGVTMGFMAATAQVVPYTPHAIAWGIGGAALVGGAAGIVLSREVRPGRRRDVATTVFALPLLATGTTGVQLTVQH